MRKLYLLKTFLLACLFSIVGGGMAWAEGSDDFAESFTKINTNYNTKTSKAGWVFTNSITDKLNGSVRPIMKGTIGAVGVITSPTLVGGCGTLKFSYALPYSTDTKGFSVTVTVINASMTESKSVEITNSSTTTKKEYEATIEHVNLEGDFIIEIKNNSPSKKKSGNYDRFAIWNIQWTSYSASGVTLEPAGLSFGSTSVSADLYKPAEFAAPTLSNPNGLTVSYASSDEAVATVNPTTGEVSLVGVGSTTITASSEETDTYYAGSASYTLNVIDTSPIAGLSGLRAKVTNTTAQEYTVNVTDAVVTYVNGKNAYMQTAEGAVLCYGKDALGLVKGQKYNGTLVVKAVLYNGLLEITSIDATGAEVSDATAEELTPQVVTLAQIIANPTACESRYVTIKDVLVTAVFKDQNATIKQGEDTYALRQNGSETLVVNLNDIIDVTGFPSIYNETLQFSVYEQAHIVQKSEVPYFRFAKTDYSVMDKTAFTAPTVETNVEGTPAYTSSNPAVATVDSETGAVTLVGVGTTVITATLAANTASYTLTVTPYAMTVFAPVTAQSQVVDGETYIVLNKAGDKAMGENSSTTKYLQDVEVSLNNGLYTSSVDGTGEPYAFQLVASGEYFKFKHGDTYLQNRGDATTVFWSSTSATSTDEFLWKIDLSTQYTSPIFNKVKNTSNRQLGYNASAPRFATYGTSKNSYTAVLYRQYLASNLTLTIGEAGYATYYSDKALVVPAGMEATTVTAANSNGTLTMAWEYQAGSIVPAGTAVLLRGTADSYDTYQLTGYPVAAPTGNLLKGSTTDAETVGGAKYYKLTYATIDGQRTIGFFWGAADGAAFINGAGKAYLALPAEMAAKGFRLDGMDVTGIGQVETGSQNGKVAYSLSGVRMDSSKVLPAGAYIINGRKVIVK